MGRGKAKEPATLNELGIIYKKTPKAVLATMLLKYIKATAVLSEWEVLYKSGIVDQRPYRIKGATPAVTNSAAANDVYNIAEQVQTEVTPDENNVADIN